MDKVQFNKEDPQLREDIVRMIIQYLGDAGYPIAMKTLYDEHNVRERQNAQAKRHMMQMRASILAGEWAAVDRLLGKPTFKNQHLFQFAILKHRYKELLEAGEHQKAYELLFQRLKPLEAFQAVPNELKDLCYGLISSTDESNHHHHPNPPMGMVGGFSANSGGLGSQGGPLRDFDRIRGRHRLVEEFPHLLMEDPSRGMTATTIQAATVPTACGAQGCPAPQVPNDRLLELLQQACAYQVSMQACAAQFLPARVTSLLSDYEAEVIPNACRIVLDGHTAGVKCVQFVGHGCSTSSSSSSSSSTSVAGSTSAHTSPTASSFSSPFSSTMSIMGSASGSNGAGSGSSSGLSQPAMLASGSSDNTICIWDIERRVLKTTLNGHNGRVWSIASGPNTQLVSASGDGTVRLWDYDHSDPCRATYAAHKGDVYSVCYHPSFTKLASAGYDTTAKLWDVETATEISTFSCHHSAPLTSVAFNGYGNLIVTASKDGSIRFCDLTFGVETMCLPPPTPSTEVSSVELDHTGLYLLASYRDSCNRIWDLRAMRCLPQRYKGHRNVSRHFIRSCFGPKANVICGASEDGVVYLWQRDTAQIMARLHGHRNVCTDVVWSPSRQLLASGGDDGTVRLWYPDPHVPLPT